MTKFMTDEGPPLDGSDSFKFYVREYNPETHRIGFSIDGSQGGRFVTMSGTFIQKLPDGDQDSVREAVRLMLIKIAESIPSLGNERLDAAIQTGIRPRPRAANRA